MIVIIGVTGGMGAGKSLVAGLMGRLLATVVVDADTLCRHLLQPQRLGWRGIQQQFGNRFFDPSGYIDRAALRQAVFTDSGLRHAVEQILHPLVRQEICDFSSAKRASMTGNFALVVEVPLLFEVGWQSDFDWIVVVYADNECCARRIVGRDGVSLDEARSSLRVQFPLIKKAWQADSVIENSGPLLDTFLQVYHLAHLWDH